MILFSSGEHEKHLKLHSHFSWFAGNKNISFPQYKTTSEDILSACHPTVGAKSPPLSIFSFFDGYSCRLQQGTFRFVWLFMLVQNFFSSFL